MKSQSIQHIVQLKMVEVKILWEPNIFLCDFNVKRDTDKQAC